MGQDSWSDDEDDGARAKERLVRVGIIGAPNAGKSVLTNTLVQSKVSAVSEKTNTTVRETLGVFTRGHTQVLLFDTPGVVDAKCVWTSALVYTRAADGNGARILRG
jgi:small GTP-binding protein